MPSLVSALPARLLRLPQAWARAWLWGVMLALVAGWVSPVVAPPVLELVCSANAEARLVPAGEDALAAALHQGHECSLCLLGQPAPPPAGQAVHFSVADMPHAAPVPRVWPHVPGGAASAVHARAPPAIMQA